MVMKKVFSILIILFLCEPALAGKKGNKVHPATKKQAVKKTDEVEKGNFYASIDAGFIIPSGLGPGFGFDIRGGYEISVHKFIRLKSGLRTGFYYGSDEGNVDSPELGGKIPYEISLYEIPIFIEGILVFKLHKLFRPFAGTGFGTTFIKSNEDFFGYNNEESKWNAGFDISWGSFFYYKHFEGIFEMRYTYIPIHYLTTGDTNPAGFGLFFGGGYRF
jgi:hypothetical protein